MAALFPKWLRPWPSREEEKALRQEANAVIAALEASHRRGQERWAALERFEARRAAIAQLPPDEQDAALAAAHDEWLVELAQIDGSHGPKEA